ncbi:probable helicase MAGATAMA 3 [Panicum virgatum]|uniref:probable helicase MAGATAMA 3 n=1 Tax=Panicum virgatum TaxID=38727 RepID=UPI0019D6120D|nr:probable helicase MAGATAMA 3 [Panicum virgatum]
MHPHISNFPNKTFYSGMIKDRTEASGVPNIFIGHNFDHYSFINVREGTEKQIGMSLVNEAEAVVAETIVDRLAKTCTYKEEKISVGVVSLYAAQVNDLEERLDRFKEHEFLSVKVQTVDSCQGDEKDIIILSMVRCNHGGNIGFLDSDRRANVALTRARKHLWILGHETTLLRSNSIWSKSTGDILIEATINEADRRVDATIEEENIGSLPGDMQRNSDMGQDQVSSLSLPQCDQFAVNNPVGTAIDEANVEFSPSHVHSRKRPCPFCKDQLAVPEVAQAIEAQAIEATVEDNDVIIEELTQLAEGSNAMKDNKRAKKANPYEQARSARDGRFWSTEQEKLDNRWID